MTATEQQPRGADTGDGEPRSVAATLADLLDDEFGDRISTTVQWDQLTVDTDAASYVDVVRFCRDDPRVDCDFFDHLAGVDEREDGFAVVANLYSTRHRHRVMVRHLCEGGRDNPVAPSLTDLYYGANWHEREAWDMFGIEFDGHPGLAPRILTTENFEGWPLRKDFYLGTREAKPWPGIKEPLELDDEGNPIERVRGGVPGEAPGPMALDEAMSEQARRANDLLDDEPVELAEGEADEAEPEAPHTTAPGGEAVQASPAEEASARAERARRKAAELRRQKREERGEEQGDERPDQGLEDTPAQQRRADEARASEATDHTSTAADGQGGPPGVPPEPESPQKQGTTPREDATEPGHGRGGGPGSQPAQAGDEPAPGAEAGEPPDTQAPGEAPVEGGLREAVDEEADRLGDATGGERPGSVDAAQDTAPATELDGGDRPESVDRARDEHPPDRDTSESEDTAEDEDGDAPAPPHRDPIGDAVAEARRNAERDGREEDDDGDDTHE